MQRFQGGLLFKAHRLCVSLNARLEGNKEEEEEKILLVQGLGVRQMRGGLTAGNVRLQGYLAHKKSPPPRDHHRAPGIGILLGPRESRFLMSEVRL